MVTAKLSDWHSLWLSRRVPASNHHVLENKSIFIFPTAFGVSYLLILLLLFILGTNYQNNIIILLSYLMGSFFITVQMTSYFNFKGLEIKSTSNVEGFAGQSIKVAVELCSKKKRIGLNLQFRQQPISKVEILEQKRLVDVLLKYEQRGVKEPGRLKVCSEHAFGLFKVWTWLDFEHQVTVFPKPKKLAVKQIQTFGNEGDEDGHITNIQGLDDFRELATYREGESLARVAWKQLARGQGKLTKHYIQEVGEAKWLMLDSVPNASLEDKLSYLSFAIIQFQQSDNDFGLKLADTIVEIGRGKNHCLKCLGALAKYGQ